MEQSSQGVIEGMVLSIKMEGEHKAKRGQSRIKQRGQGQEVIMRLKSRCNESESIQEMEGCRRLRAESGM